MENPHEKLIKAISTTKKDTIFFDDGGFVQEFLDCVDFKLLKFEYENSYEYNYPIYVNDKGEVLIPFEEKFIKYQSFDSYDLSTYLYGENGMSFLWGRSKMLKNNIYDNYQNLTSNFFKSLGLSFESTNNCAVLDNYIENLSVEEKYKFLNIYLVECIGVLLFELSQQGFNIDFELSSFDNISWEPFLLWKGQKIKFLQPLFSKIFDTQEIKNIISITFDSQLLIASNLEKTS